MAYDPVKAHEYYVKYRKKGLKKGRKKGRKTKAKQISLVGLSTAGLNDSGKMQASLLKENIKAEMNAAIAKETDPVKKEALRQEYQKKALNEISKLKADPQYAKPKTQKAKKERSSDSESKERKEREREAKVKEKEAKAEREQLKTKAIQATTKQAETVINTIMSRINNMTPEQKAQAKDLVQTTINEIQAVYDGLLESKKKIEEIYK